MLSAFNEWYALSARAALENHLDRTVNGTTMTLTTAMPNSFTSRFFAVTERGVHLSDLTSHACEAIRRFRDKCPGDELLGFEDAMSRPTDGAIDTLLQFLSLMRLVAVDPSKYR